MSRVVKQQILELEGADYHILRHLAFHAGVSRAQVLRWALRWYLIGGPWPKSSEIRQQIVQDCEVGQIGPKTDIGGV